MMLDPILFVPIVVSAFPFTIMQIYRYQWSQGCLKGDWLDTMKSILLEDRMKEKDAYDTYYCLKQYSDRLDRGEDLLPVKSNDNKLLTCEIDYMTID